MTPDTRSPWQITVSLWTQVAAVYLRYLDMDNGEAEAYRAAYKVGDIKQWARQRINMAIETANTLIAEHGTDQRIIARDVAPCSIEYLHDMGLSGTVQSEDADSCRIEQAGAVAVHHSKRRGSV